MDEVDMLIELGRHYTENIAKARKDSERRVDVIVALSTHMKNHEIAKELGISQARICQILKKAGLAVELATGEGQQGKALT